VVVATCKDDEDDGKSWSQLAVGESWESCELWRFSMEVFYRAPTRREPGVWHARVRL
jgi:hypothetical protein